MTIEPFGDLNFISRDNEWFGEVDNISPYNKVELSICVDNKDQNITEKIELIKQFARDYDQIISDLFLLAFKKYQGTKDEKLLEEIKQMYFLIAVVLKNDSETWWLTLEPNFKVPTAYDQFLRFTMSSREIVWTNFNTNTTA